MGLNNEAMKKRAETIGRGDSLYFKLEEGKKNTVRILPRSIEYFTKVGDNDFAYSYHSHYNLFDVDGYRKVICKQTSGQKCPICDYASSLEDKTKGKTLRARESYVYNVFDYDSGRIKIWETGPFIYEEIFKYVVDPDWGDLFDLKNGRDIKIEVEIIPQNQKGKKNPYQVTMVPNKTDISELLPDKFDEVIDGLKEKIPVAHDDAFYLKIVEHLRNGSRPEPIIRDKKPVDEKSEVVPKSNGEKPECFGIEYSPRADKCKTCSAKVECRDETLKL